MGKRPTIALRSGDERDCLVLKWRWLVRHIMKRLPTAPLMRLGLDDAEQEGLLGLVRAAERWDPAFRTPDGQPVQFQTYAATAIIKNILRACRMISVVRFPRTVKDPPPVCRLPEWDMLEDTDYDNGDDEEELSYWRRLASERMPLLDDRQRLAVQMRAEGASLADIGKAIGFTRERARQILDEGMAAIAVGKVKPMRVTTPRPPKTPRRDEMYKFCYERHQFTSDRMQDIARDCRALYGHPQVTDYIRAWSQRYAERHHLPYKPRPLGRRKDADTTGRAA